MPTQLASASVSPSSSLSAAALISLSRRRIVFVPDRGQQRQPRHQPISLHRQSPLTKSLAFTCYLATGNSHYCKFRRISSMSFHSSNDRGNSDCDAAAMSSPLAATASLSTTTTTTRQPIRPCISSRTNSTLDPCVILMKQLISQHAHKWENTVSNSDGHHGIYSLAQGVVYWRPPISAYESLMHAAQGNMMIDCDPNDGSRGKGAVGGGDVRLIHTYCPDEGYPPLLSALQHKLQKENGLSNPHIIVTSGANQAYVNCVLTLLDERRCVNDDDVLNHATETTHINGVGSKSNLCIDKCVVFEPYYFNHVMAIQSVRGGRGCGGTATADKTNDQSSSMSTSSSSSSCDNDKTMTVEGLLVGPTIRGIPDLKWLRSTLHEYQYSYHDDSTNATIARNAIRMVTLVNPGNPTGISLPHHFLNDIVQLTKEYGVWLIVDNTYEHFDVDGENRLPPVMDDDDEDDTKQKQQPDFPCFDEEHVINIFSFSKGYASTWIVVCSMTTTMMALSTMLCPLCIVVNILLLTQPNVFRKKR